MKYFDFENQFKIEDKAFGWKFSKDFDFIIHLKFSLDAFCSLWIVWRKFQEKTDEINSSALNIRKTFF
jgi:hypothetical protein